MLGLIETLKYDELWHNIDIGAAGVLKLVLDYIGYEIAVHKTTSYTPIVSRAKLVSSLRRES